MHMLTTAQHVQGDSQSSSKWKVHRHKMFSPHVSGRSWPFQPPSQFSMTAIPCQFELGCLEQAPRSHQSRMYFSRKRISSIWTSATVPCLNLVQGGRAILLSTAIRAQQNKMQASKPHLPICPFSATGAVYSSSMLKNPTFERNRSLLKAQNTDDACAW